MIIHRVRIQEREFKVLSICCYYLTLFWNLLLSLRAFQEINWYLPLIWLSWQLVFSSSPSLKNLWFFSSAFFTFIFHYKRNMCFLQMKLNNRKYILKVQVLYSPFFFSLLSLREDKPNNKMHSMYTSGSCFE